MTTAVAYAPAVSTSVHAAADAAATCCLCLDGDSAENPLLQFRVCDCKGSMRFHRDCVFSMASYNPACGACKKTLLHPDFAAVSYDPEDPDMTDATYTTQAGALYGKLHAFYHVDEAGERHGLCKVFYQEHNTCYHPENPLTIYEVKHYNHGVLHGTYKRWSAFEAKGGIQYPDVETTYDQGVLKGPFKRYNSYDEGRLTEHGTLHSTPLKTPGIALPFGFDALFIGEYVGDEMECEKMRCVFKVPSTKPCILAGDHAAFAALAATLADGTHIIPFRPVADYDGKPGHSDGSITFTVANGLLKGAWTATLESGQIVEERTYVAGARHGRYMRMYYDSLGYGEYELLGLAEEGTYVAGKRNGKATFNKVTCHEKVVPRNTVHYNHGRIVGEQTLYDNDGRILETTTLAEDGTRYLEGPAIFYEGGVIVQRCSFRLDELHGPLTLYTNSGMPWLQVTMARGMLKAGSWITYYDETGAIDKVKSRRLPDDDYLASIEELDNKSVRCLAWTYQTIRQGRLRVHSALPFYVELREEAAEAAAAVPAVPAAAVPTATVPTATVPTATVPTVDAEQAAIEAEEEQAAIEAEEERYETFRLRMNDECCYRR
jgi:antitoxin component YwqK of YwqJK toxin-antitoxin module